MTLHNQQAQNWDPDQYAQHARFVSDLGEPVIDLLAPKPSERILDLGCGDGLLTQKLVAAGCHVLAIDSSPEQVAAARKNGLDARVANAESLSFHEEFDAVFSNATLHWIRNADAVIRGVFQALKPGGRFIAEMGGARNIKVIHQALIHALNNRGIEAATIDPWFFPTAEEYQELLEKHEFHVERISLFHRPTVLPGDISDWLETFAKPFLNVIQKDQQKEVIEEIRNMIRPKLYDLNRGWVADYVRLRFVAHRPSTTDASMSE